MTYVLDADNQKRKPLDTIEAILQFHRIRRYSRFGIEVNQFQEFLASELKRAILRRHVHLPIRELRHSSDKLGRIQSLEPLITLGNLRFSRRHRTLLDQLRQFPKAAHDDGPDALQMAVQVSQRPKGRLVV